MTAAPSSNFPSTAWSCINAAKDPDHPKFRKAMERLATNYWRPVFRFLRSTRPSAEAEDLTGAFFCRCLEGKSPLRLADPSRGRFRDFLRTVVKRFAYDQAVRPRAQLKFEQGLVSIHAACLSTALPRHFRNASGGMSESPVPQPQRPVRAPRDGVAAVGAPRHRGHIVPVPLEGAKALAAGYLPKPQRLVRAPREGTAAVGTPRHRHHRPRVPLEGAEALAAGHLLQRQRMVITPREGAAAVGAPRHRGHRARVLLEGTLFPAFQKAMVGQGVRQQPCQL